MEIIFILVEPSVPENIGAAARAIKTMGFSSLRLINTIQHLADEARWLAHGSLEILDQAVIFPNLAEALSDIDFAIGTTAKNRSVKFDYKTPEEAKRLIGLKEESLNKVALIFGREESGLTNEELALCDIGVTIPIKASYPSINLAQSVMIMAYVLSDCELNASKNKNNTPNYLLLKQKTAAALERLDIKTGENLHGRIMERIASVGAQDINLFLSVLAKIEKHIK